MGQGESKPDPIEIVETLKKTSNFPESISNVEGMQGDGGDGEEFVQDNERDEQLSEESATLIIRECVDKAVQAIAPSMGGLDNFTFDAYEKLDQSQIDIGARNAFVQEGLVSALAQVLKERMENADAALAAVTGLLLLLVDYTHEESISELMVTEKMCHLLLNSIARLADEGDLVADAIAALKILTKGNEKSSLILKESFLENGAVTTLIELSHMYEDDHSHHYIFDDVLELIYNIACHPSEKIKEEVVDGGYIEFFTHVLASDDDKQGAHQGALEVCLGTLLELAHAPDNRRTIAATTTGALLSSEMCQDDVLCHLILLILQQLAICGRCSQIVRNKVGDGGIVLELIQLHMTSKDVVSEATALLHALFAQDFRSKEVEDNENSSNAFEMHGDFSSIMKEAYDRYPNEIRMKENTSALHRAGVVNDTFMDLALMTAKEHDYQTLVKILQGGGSGTNDLGERAAAANALMAFMLPKTTLLRSMIIVGADVDKDFRLNLVQLGFVEAVVSLLKDGIHSNECCMACMRALSVLSADHEEQPEIVEAVVKANAVEFMVAVMINWTIDSGLQKMAFRALSFLTYESEPIRKTLVQGKRLPSLFQICVFHTDYLKGDWCLLLFNVSSSRIPDIVVGLIEGKVCLQLRHCLALYPSEPLSPHDLEAMVTTCIAVSQHICKAVPQTFIHEMVLPLLEDIEVDRLEISIPPTEAAGEEGCETKPEKVSPHIFHRLHSKLRVVEEVLPSIEDAYSLHQVVLSVVREVEASIFVTEDIREICSRVVALIVSSAENPEISVAKEEFNGNVDAAPATEDDMDVRKALEEIERNKDEVVSNQQFQASKKDGMLEISL